MPADSTKTAFGNLGDYELLISWNDFRINNVLEPTTVLAITEGQANMTLDVKGKNPKFREKPAPPSLLTTNYLGGVVQGWEEQDVEALKDRVRIVRFDLKLPDEVRQSAEVNVNKSKCRYCSAMFVAWVCPPIAAQLGLDAAKVVYQPSLKEQIKLASQRIEQFYTKKKEDLEKELQKQRNSNGA